MRHFHVRAKPNWIVDGCPPPCLPKHLPNAVRLNMLWLVIVYKLMSKSTRNNAGNTPEPCLVALGIPGCGNQRASFVPGR